MKFLVMLLLSVQFSMAADDYMYFLVDSMNLTRLNLESNLAGITSAQKLYIMMDDHEFEINSNGDDLFHANTYLENYRIYFSRDGMKFSTSIEPSNILFSLNHLSASKAEIELGKEEIKIQGASLEAHTPSLAFKVANVDMRCDTGGEFTSDVDVACVKNTRITPFNSDYGYLSLTDLSGNNLFDIELDTTSLSIVDDLLDVETVNIRGKIDKGVFTMGLGTLSCYKDPELSELDVDRILSGCILESKIVGKNFVFKQSGINALVRDVNINLERLKLEVKAADVKFKTKTEDTYVDNFKLTCNKKAIDIDSARDDIIINGCLEKMRFDIDQMDSDSKVKSERPEELFDITNFKEVSLAIDNGNFHFKGKTKVLFRVPFSMSGFASYQPLEKQLALKIRKASILGVSAKRLAIFILAKFIDSQQVRIDGDKVIIQL